MRKSVLVACSLLVLLAVSPAFAGGDHAFFDMENCAMCSNLTKDAQLLPNLGWENSKVANGMVTITTYKTPEAEASFAKAHKEMEAVVAKMMAGEKMELCGFCVSMGAVMQAGATHEEVPFEGGSVGLMTSEDPATIEMIHAHCDKVNEEMKKMQASMES